MKPLFLVLLALVFGSAVAFGLSEDEVFADGAFDAAVAEGKAADDANKLTWLGGITLVSSTGLVLPEAATSYGSQSTFMGKAFAKATKPSLGSLFVSYNLSHALWSSTNDATLASGYTRAGVSSSPQYSLSEFHLSFDVDKKVFLRLGNQLIDWGASAVWSPADFINRKTDPTASIDTRAGKAGLRVHVPWAGGNVFAFLDASRSLTSGGAPKDLVEVGTVGLKVDTTIGGWNLGLVGNGGKTTDPRLGITGVGAVWGIDLWSEVGGALPLDGRNGSWAASLGGERSWGTDREWTLRGEGFWNPQGRGDTVLNGVQLVNFAPFYWGQAYAYGELIRKKLFGPDVTGSWSATVNLSDRSWTSTASLRTAIGGLPPFSLYTQYNGGDNAREFTWATGGPAWTFGLRSIVEF